MHALSVCLSASTISCSSRGKYLLLSCLAFPGNFPSSPSLLIAPVSLCPIMPSACLLWVELCPPSKVQSGAKEGLQLFLWQMAQ